MTQWNVIYQISIVLRNGILLCFLTWAVMRLAMWAIEFLFGSGGEE
ncbi:hypothetical protein [Komagataeibacter xylinus]|nr:hypothetical protein [Komagataeibacter xylinus]